MEMLVVLLGTLVGLMEVELGRLVRLLLLVLLVEGRLVDVASRGSLVLCLRRLGRAEVVLQVLLLVAVLKV